MPKRNKEAEDHLMDIKYMLAGILLDRKPNIKEVAKIVGCSDNALTALYPDRQKKKKGKEETAESKTEESIPNASILDETNEQQ